MRSHPNLDFNSLHDVQIVLRALIDIVAMARLLEAEAAAAEAHAGMTSSHEALEAAQGEVRDTLAASGADLFYSVWKRKACKLTVRDTAYSGSKSGHLNLVLHAFRGGNGRGCDAAGGARHRKARH